MKKTVFSLLACVFILSGSFAQESYTIKSSMKMEGLPPEAAGFGEMDIVAYMKGDKYKRETTSMMGTFISCFDGKLFTSITDYMGNKTGFTASKEELDQTNEKDKTAEKPKIDYTQEKKTIAGYECSKAILTSIGKDGKEKKVTVWVTDKIKNTAAKGKKPGERGMQMDFGDLNGHPMEIEFSQNQMGTEVKVLITTTDVQTTSLDDTAFTVSTDGYTMMSYKEMQEKMKGARKGE